MGKMKDDLGFTFLFIEHEVYWNTVRVYGGTLHIQYFIDTQPLIENNIIRALQ